MNYIASKALWIVVLIALLIIAGVDIRIGYTQTSLSVLQDRVAELERKLADAKMRQEKAQSVQMQLEEQEQKLTGLEKYLSESDKYRIQVVEIRMDIKKMRVKIEAIAKEKNDFEENLQLARNLQAMLYEAKMMARQENNILANESEESSADKPTTWRIENIHIDNNFNENEHSEITSLFISGRQINQEDILNSAYQIYNRTGVSINFIAHSKNGDVIDLDILLNQRIIMNSKAMLVEMINIDEFKSNYFDLTIKDKK